jgi:hypothetical protein
MKFAEVAAGYTANSSMDFTLGEGGMLSPVTGPVVVAGSRARLFMFVYYLFSLKMNCWW